MGHDNTHPITAGAHPLGREKAQQTPPALRIQTGPVLTLGGDLHE